MSVDICYVISHGFAARMVLHSALLPELQRRGLSVGLIAPDAGDPSTRELAARHGVELFDAPSLPARHAAERERLRRYLFEDVRQNPALWAKHLRDVRAPGRRLGRRLQASAYLALNRLCVRFPALRRRLGQLERQLLDHAPSAALLGRIRPALLVSTYPVSPLEATLVHEAQKLGIATAGQLLSWDNITCKGRFSAVPDRFIAWGPIMADELRAYYQVDEEDVAPCGVAHFDAHLHDIPQHEIEARLLALGLEPARPYLFFGMSSPYFAPREIDVVEWLARAVQEDVFGPDVQLVVRPHPQNVTGHMADASWLPRLQKLEGARVAVDYPRLAEEGGLVWSMREDDLPHLATLLRGCAVSLNSGSTLSIDAILHDKPVVLTPFDAGEALPWWESARRVVDYPHLEKLIRLGGVRVTTSFSELEQAVQAYLAQPARDAEGRARVRAQECGPCDGQTASRIADALAQYAGVQAEEVLPA